MTTITVVFKIAVCVISVIIIALVLMQRPKEDASSALMGGGGDTYYDKMKGKTSEGKLLLLTKVFIGIFVVTLIVMMFI